MGFAGTLLFTGQATALVVETGNRAEIGKIAGLLGSVKQATTPLLIQIEHFGRTVSCKGCEISCQHCCSLRRLISTGVKKQTSVICIIIALATFFISWKGRSMPLFEAFHAAVGVAVALIPEGMRMIVCSIMLSPC